MSYESKCSITPIITGRWDNLSISTEFDRNPKFKFPMFLFTPDMNNPNNHYHIKLTKKRARILRDWLNAYLKEMGE